MTSNDLKKIIEQEADHRNWSPATLCKRAVGNNRLHKTLAGGGSCTLDVAERLTKWLNEHPVSEQVRQ